MKDNKPDRDAQIRGRIKDFVEDSEDRILVLTGMFGQCLRCVVRLAEEAVMRTNKTSYTVLSPAARIVYPGGNKSVYGLMYKRSPYFDKDEQIFVHERVCNEACQDHLYIVGDAHSIGNSPRKSGIRRFGSGKLFNDLMAFIDLCNSERRIIFIGDPCQISSFSMPRIISKLKECSKSVQHMPLEHYRCTQWSALFLENRELLAERIKKRLLNRLSLSLNDSDCVQLSDLPGDVDQLIKKSSDDNKNFDPILVAFTHEQVNQYNRGIRSRAFGRGPELTENDRIVTYNHLTISHEQNSHEIPSGSFGTVVRDVLEKETIEQSLTGRGEPIRIKFIKVVVRWKDAPGEHEHLCFEDFLYAKKPELGKDEFIALVAYTRKWSKIRKYAQSQVDASENAGDGKGLTPDMWKAIMEYARTQLSEEKSSLAKDGWQDVLDYAEKQAYETENLSGKWKTIREYAEGKVSAENQEKSKFSRDEWKAIQDCAKIWARTKGEKWFTLSEYVKNQWKAQGRPVPTKDHWREILKYAKTRVDTPENLDGKKENLSGPYLNAVMLRFGYAITLHRAQGCLHNTVIADLSPESGMGGEGYFRWLYTAFSVPKKSIYLINVPRKNPFRKTVWDLNKSQIDSSIQPSNLIGYNPSDPDPDAIKDFPTNQRELRNLYWFIRRRLDPVGVRIVKVKHHEYQEVYTFEGPDECACTLRFYYNGKYQITCISVLKSRLADFTSRVLEELVSSPVFPDTFTEEIYDAFRDKLKVHGIQITAVEHHDFQEVYFVEGDGDKARLHAHYNKSASVTKVVLERHSSENIRDLLKSIFGP